MFPWEETLGYCVHEIFYSLQGEGAWSGRAAIFCRFAGCNLWSGREQDRAVAICSHCDTEFRGPSGVNGGVFESAPALVEALVDRWRAETNGHRRPFVVCTGGEPLLQLDRGLIATLHAQHCEVAVETNGTLRPPVGIDWLCVSPKAGAPLLATCGDELKLVFPQSGLDPERLEQLDFRHFFLQPMDGPDRRRNTMAAIDYCKTHPRWRLSTQIHKWLGIP